MRRGVGCLCAAAALSPVVAHADEPKSSTEPRVMMESGEVTNVVDAFDDGDVFDANVSLGFQFASKSAKIYRETSIAAPGLSSGGYTSRLMNVAQYSSTIARLTPRVDIGIYHDLAIYARLPIVLSYQQKLDGLEGSENKQSVTLAGMPGEQLFSLPFKSPDRSGLEYLALGFEFDIFNQARDKSKPTWLFGAEVRLAVGDPMQACNTSTTRLNAVPTGFADRTPVQCASPTDVNRDGQNEDGSAAQLEGNDVSARTAGVTRGTIGLEAHTILSKRVKYIEPYGGFAALVEFYNSDDFTLTNLDGSLVNHPPFRGKMILGTMIIPWENREKYGRFTLDFRFTGEYVSEGRDYSELFDALGSSDAPSMRYPQWAAYRQNPNFNEGDCTDGDSSTPCYPRSVVDQGSQKTYNTGLTDVYAHGSYRASASATWQASEYVKFSIGGGFQFDQGHIITGDQPCNSAFKEDVGRSGPCHSGNDNTQELVATGIPNPNYRSAVNVVGRRFYVDTSATWDVAISGTVMF
ncbi:MAG: hypothetical protein IPK82_26255 [Polyangiaceae bacterium]|nr:hypothetical protein [Polyangiaceae bacterium]